MSAILVFYLKPAFNDQPVWIALINKLGITFLIFILISFILLVLYFLFHQYEGSFGQYMNSFFTKVAFTKRFFIFLIDMALMSFLSISILEVTDKYGPGMFWSMLIGQYHHPKRENRIFIFLDINESTTIAEQLGHEEYFYMLRRFFSNITHPVLANDGEIYQYVGDEIVLTWPNTPENKAKSLKFIRNSFYLIERKSDEYKKRFGKVPRFKAGIHAGEVTAGFIGVIKKELIYSGDTLNTASRIRSMCHELNESFLLSEDFLQDFNQPSTYEINPVCKVELKGRLEPTQLFSLKFA
jgi:adenylate cyclase